MEKLMGEQAGDSVKRAGPWPEMPQLYWDEGEVLPADEADELQSEDDHHRQHEAIVDPRPPNVGEGIAVVQDQHTRGRLCGALILSVRGASDQLMRLRPKAGDDYWESATIPRSLTPARAAATFISAEDTAY
jgi:hypothetical protein